MIKDEVLLSVGLMSGTSMDGVDAALIETDGYFKIKEIKHISINYSTEFHQLLKAAEYLVCLNNGIMSAAHNADFFRAFEDYLVNKIQISKVLALEKIRDASLYLHGNPKIPVTLAQVIEHSTKLHETAVFELLKAAGYESHQIDLIGYHGQTLFHRPSQRITIQVGNSQDLADNLGITVVSDFRGQDVANGGGQGAPLAPLYHMALAIRDNMLPLAVVNCGGIANISLILGDQFKDILGYDTGPGNGLIDLFVKQRTNFKENIDQDGRYGLNGKVHFDVINKLYAKCIQGRDYFNLPPPKSLDINDLKLIAELDELSLEDGCATLAAFTADSIVKSLKLSSTFKPKYWVLAGGGWSNPVIKRELEKRVKIECGNDVLVKLAQEVSWNNKAMEAQIFAYLAVRGFKKLVISVPETTGVTKQISLVNIAIPLSWDCFDIAVGITGKAEGRKKIVQYALGHSNNVKFRSLLAPEIKLAVMLNFLPLSMHSEELKEIVNNYTEAYKRMLGVVTACNDSIGLAENSRLSLEELDCFFEKQSNKSLYYKAYVMFEKARYETYTFHEQAFDTYCQREDIYVQYVKDYYGKNNWFALQKSVNDKAFHTSMIDIVANMLDIVIVIYQENREIYRTINKAETIIEVNYDGRRRFSKKEVEYLEVLSQSSAKSLEDSAREEQLLSQGITTELQSDLEEGQFSSQVSQESAKALYRSLSMGSEQSELCKKTSNDADLDLQLLLEEVRSLSINTNLSLEYLAKKTRELDILLWNRLPHSVRTASLSGFISMQIVYGIIFNKEKESAGVKEYANRVKKVTEVAANYLPIKLRGINLKFWIDELFNIDGNFKRIEHEMAQAKMALPDQPSTLAEILDLIPTKILPNEIRRLFSSCDEVATLLEELRDIDRKKTSKDIVTAYLLKLGDFWKKEREELLKLKLQNSVTNNNSQIMLMYSLMFYNNKDKINQQRLSDLRSKFNTELGNILKTNTNANDDDSLLKIATLLQNLINNLVIQMKEFIGTLISQVEKTLDPTPCSYAFIGLGNLEKQFCTPYSDWKFAILIEEDTEENRQYFRNLSYKLQTKIINLGETPIPFSLFDYSFDHLIAQGFCFDLDGKTALGRYYDDETAGEKYGKLKYELIGSPKSLSRYLEDEWFEIDKLLPIEMASCAHIAGDVGLTKKYQLLIQERLQNSVQDGGLLCQQRAIKLLSEDLKLCASQTDLNNLGKIYDVKKEIYLIPDRLINNLAFFYGITEGNISEKINALINYNHISEDNWKHLQIINGIANELRLTTYFHYRQQKSKMWILGFSKGIYKHENFYLGRHRAFLERFYYTAFPLFKFLDQWPANRVNIYLFDNSLKIMAETCMRLHDYTKAQEYLKRCLIQYPKDLDVVLKLGFVAVKLNNHKQALEYYQQALEIIQKIYVNEHPILAASFNNIGMVYKDLGNHQKALGHCHKALLIQQKIYGIKSRVVADSLNNIGSIYSDLGNWQQALKYYQQALEMMQKIYEEPHPDIAAILNNIGSIYKELNEINIALEFFEKALEINKKLYDDSHPSIATNLNNIGDIYGALGKVQKALEYFEKSLEVNKKLYGNMPCLEVTNNLNNIGIACQALSVPQTALEFFEKALEINKKLYGDLHQQVAKSLHYIGSAYQALGASQKALEFFEKALEINKKLYGNSHQQVAKSLHCIGSAYQALGTSKKALELFEKAEAATPSYLANFSSSAISHSMPEEANTLEAFESNFPIVVDHPRPTGL